ncbi:MEDS domain-containing protein [Natronococcus wangiae]|uniref:MEDS domain-containing protein n=1 Tax=Natronococcus wangiae TaxID=3068275 RepID=UPI00273FAD5A|nr:MEDS domain-containing protein [Natronococcus sp. AD5]
MSEMRETADDDVSALERGFEAPSGHSDFHEFRGPATQIEGYEYGTADHFGLVYETREEQFTAVVPYIEQGIERNERCMYIASDNTRAEVLEALRAGGIDVDAALETGQLSIHTVEETYLEGGEFEVDEGRTLLGSAMEDALAAYDGFRVTAEETWLIGDGGRHEAFMACESHVNDLLDGENAMALCQYNRDELSPEIIADAIRTHPYLIYDGTVCQNVFYTPTEEYFGPTVCPAITSASCRR